MREFLEKNYTDDAIETDDLTIKLVIKALLEVSVLRRPHPPPLTGQACWVTVAWLMGSLYSLVSWVSMRNSAVL